MNNNKSTLITSLRALVIFRAYGLKQISNTPFFDLKLFGYEISPPLFHKRILRGFFYFKRF